jgi:hypothetical protein
VKYEQNYTLEQSFINIAEYVIRSNISLQIVKAQIKLCREKNALRKIRIVDWTVVNERILMELAPINPTAPEDLIRTTFRMM